MLGQIQDSSIVASILERGFNSSTIELNGTSLHSCEGATVKSQKALPSQPTGAVHESVVIINPKWGFSGFSITPNISGSEGEHGSSKSFGPLPPRRSGDCRPRDSYGGMCDALRASFLLFDRHNHRRHDDSPADFRFPRCHRVLDATVRAWGFLSRVGGGNKTLRRFEPASPSIRSCISDGSFVPGCRCVLDGLPSLCSTEANLSISNFLNRSYSEQTG